MSAVIDLLRISQPEVFVRMGIGKVKNKGALIL